MFELISIVLLFVRLTIQCESIPNIWTYYPCSFTISSSSSSPLSCSKFTIKSSIDQCLNEEMTFFWHFPSGNMTLVLQSDNEKPFLLRLLKKSLSQKKLIKNVFHLRENSMHGEDLLNQNDHQIIVIPSDEHHRCSLRFETFHPLIFDYGLFIRMTIINQTEH